MKQIILSLCAIVFLCGASPRYSSDTLPGSLKPYVQDGVFDPGDFEWLRGLFPEATDQQKEDYQAIIAWRKACADQEASHYAAELAALGFPDVKSEAFFATTDFCAQFAVGPKVESFTSFADFQEALRTVQPVYKTLKMTIHLAETHRDFSESELAEQLIQRPMTEQILRAASSWDREASADYFGPSIGKKQAAIFGPMVWRDVMLEDRANTAWLKTIIDDGGWPTISKVGKEASSSAWLLVQHADHDPVFQLRTLREMEPLVEQSEVSKRNFAYLYDRVMLKLTGKQRYATQVFCEGGIRVAQPLEDETALAELRASVGLEPFDEYLTWFSIPCRNKS